MTNLPISTSASKQISQIEFIIGQDEGDRGMESLVVPGDLEHAAKILARLQPLTTLTTPTTATTTTTTTASAGTTNTEKHSKPTPVVVILSGFPCCVTHDPPTETDGPPGAIAIAKCALGMGYQVILVTDECNQAVFQAACDTYNAQHAPSSTSSSSFQLKVFPSSTKITTQEKEQMKQLAETNCDLIIACERAGPAADGNCYTMRGIDMTSKGLIAPLHLIVDMARKRHGDKVPFIAIGDGGNEMGMGKVIDVIRTNPKIQNGSLIGAVTEADYLIAASVSNWGGYALAAAAAVVRQNDVNGTRANSINTTDGGDGDDWVQKCVPTEDEEVRLLKSIVSKGCRDGVSGKMEATVDGMPLETSLSCLRSIRAAAKESMSSNSVS